MPGLDVENLLPVETFREYIAYNPFHFWGLSNQQTAPVNSACNEIVYEYAWQSADAGGREDARKAIIEAEKKFRDHLGYPTREAYFSETINLGCFKHYNRDNLYGGAGYYNPGYSVLVQLSQGQLKAIQTEAIGALALVAGAAVQYTDDDGDGNLDRFYITITDSTSDPENIELRFVAGDVLFSWSAARRKIAPVVVDRPDSTHIRIQGPAWIMVAPKKYGAYNYDQLDPVQSTTFVQTADVFLRTTSDADQASFYYYDSNNALQSKVFTAEICDPEAGLVMVRSSECLDFCYCGSKRSQNLVVNYRAGAPDGTFDAEVTYLAIAELRRRLCACADANGQLYKWQVDLAMPAGASMARISVDPSDLANPIGTVAGQVAAWKKIQLYRQVHGTYLG